MKRFVFEAMVWAAFLFSTEVSAQSAANAPMQFHVVSNGGNCDGCEWIVADGVITSDTPATFRQLADGLGSTRYFVALNSPGGSLIAGLRLGEQIRKRGFDTSIGRTVMDPEGKFATLNTGVCYSACALAFLGGRERSVRSGPAGSPIGDSFGVHQFYRDEALSDPQRKAFDAIDISIDQVLSGMVLDYIARMGVDPRLQAIAAGVSPWEPIRVLSRQELIDLNVVNDVERFSGWTIEAYQAGAVLTGTYRSGMQEPVNVTFFCRRSASTPYVLLSAAFKGYLDANPGTTAESLEGMIQGAAISINGETLTLSPPMVDAIKVRIDQGGMIYATIPLTGEVVVALTHAQRFGVEVELPRVTGYPWTLPPADVSGVSRPLKLVMRNCLS